jgi:hypothetical protein
MYYKIRYNEEYEKFKILQKIWETKQSLEEIDRGGKLRRDLPVTCSRQVTESLSK